MTADREPPQSPVPPSSAEPNQPEEPNALPAPTDPAQATSPNDVTPGSSGAPDAPPNAPGAPAPTLVALDTRNRLHPLSLLFSFIDSVRNFIIPGLLVLIFAWGDKYELWVMVFFLPAMITSILRYISLTYEITTTEVVIRQGIVSRTERHILIDRIQNLDTVQSPMQRMFGVAELTIETAGGATEAEASLKVVSRDVVDEIRAHVKGRRTVTSAADGESSLALPSADETAIDPAAATPEPRDDDDGTPAAGIPATEAPAAETSAALDEPPILRMTMANLVAYGLASGRGLAIVGAGMAIGWQFGIFDRMSERIETVFPWIEGIPVFWAVVVGVPAGFVVLALLSIVWAFLKLFGFELRRTDDGLHSVCGLLTRREATIPNGRIQSLSIRQNLFHRITGSFTMRVQTAGGETNAQDQLNRFWVVPIARLNRAPELVNAILPDTDFMRLVWQKPHPRVRRRMFFRWLLLTAFVTGILHLNGAGGWTALPLAAIPLGWVAACLRYRMLEHAFDDDRLHVVDGLLGRRHDIVPVARIQAIGLQQTPIDRYHGLSSVNVAIAGPFGSGARARVFGLPLRRGMRLYHRLRDRTEREGWAVSAALDHSSAV